MALPRAVDLHHRIRAISTGVILVSRLGCLAMVVLSIVALARIDGYTNRPLATVVYLGVAAWSMVFLPVVVVRDALPRRVLAGDVAVTAAAVATLPWALDDEAFSTVAVPDFEPVGVSAAVAWRWPPRRGGPPPPDA